MYGPCALGAGLTYMLVVRIADDWEWTGVLIGTWVGILLRVVAYNHFVVLPTYDNFVPPEEPFRAPYLGTREDEMSEMRSACNSLRTSEMTGRKSGLSLAGEIMSPSHRATPGASPRWPNRSSKHSSNHSSPQWQSRMKRYDMSPHPSPLLRPDAGRSSQQDHLADHWGAPSTSSVPAALYAWSQGRQDLRESNQSIPEEDSDVFPPAESPGVELLHR